MTLFEKAVVFAAEAHAGQKRKGKDKPYILHPMETAAIVGRCLDRLEGTGSAPKELLDERDELLAAAVLHDVAEDAGVSFGELASRFGEKVAKLVAEESENKREDQPAEGTWRIRKQETIDRLKDGNIEAKLLCLGDKLSNLREIAADYEVLGEELWERFNRKDSSDHKWYYGEILRILEEDPVLGDLPAVWEYAELWDEVFGEEGSEEETGEHFCTNCGAVLDDQPGFDPEKGVWRCTECGAQLYGDGVYAGEKYPDIMWFCDRCDAFLNKQEGFRDDCGTWKCRECGHVNTIDETEIRIH